MKRGELDDLVAFTTIARTRSFTRAAAELGVSPSALSHTIRELELRLNVRLLARTTRSVAPTPAGDHLLRSLEPALKAVETGLEALSDWRGEPSGSLRITACPFSTQTVLAAALPQFLVEHPKVSVEVSITSRLVDLVRDGFDAGIRWGEKVEQDMVAVRVASDTRMIVVAAPAYLERHPRPESPDDLDLQNCVNFRQPTTGAQFPWALTREGKEIRGDADGQLMFDEPDIAAPFIVSGAGLGLMLEQTAAPYLTAGHLVQVLPEWSVPLEGLHIFYPSRHVSPALRELVEALRWRP